ncbi:hypothetical protein [Rhodopila sp.]|jgi:hypothetical protein|uniref:hypothetical protein n=1 Tax=Rhodopila sp. TaxID=2480087 RepID=UPI002C376BF0|nr:hypothetical protein [Rhodopila sp.]HVZ10625.1 hypothetical protein [Rhodopila sp.]
MGQLRGGHIGFAILLALAGGLITTRAKADSLCAGSVTGSVLQALPTPTTVSPSQPISDNRNPELTKAFLQGIQSAGLTVLPANQGNVQVDMTFTVTPPGGGAGNDSTFRGFGWMSGTHAPGGGVPVGSRVSISIEATNLNSQTLSWIGTIACTVQASDPDRLATHFGELVGRALGRSINRQAL